MQTGKRYIPALGDARVLALVRIIVITHPSLVPIFVLGKIKDKQDLASIYFPFLLCPGTLFQYSFFRWFSKIDDCVGYLCKILDAITMNECAQPYSYSVYYNVSDVSSIQGPSF